MTRLPYGETPENAHTRLREVRKRLRLTLEEVAHRVGTTRQTIQRWEVDGRAITVKRLHEIAEALGVPVHSLLPGHEELSPAEQEMLDWMRSATPTEIRTVESLKASLQENRREAFETRPPRK